MKTSAPAAVTARPANSSDENLRHLPPAARAAFAQFQAGADPAVLDPVIFAILEDFIPRTPAKPLAGLPGTTRLIEDLRFDSLAITEVVFFTEELFGINISNAEIMQVRTLDDLRGFIQQKVRPAPPA
jgi:acyl carrier protein